MGMLDNFTPVQISELKRELKEREAENINLSALIYTNRETSKKSLQIVMGGGPCGIEEEKWLAIHAHGNTRTDIYHFNGEEIKGKEEVISRMKKYVTENYSHLLK